MSIEIGRRAFLRGTSLGTASLALGSCATLQQCHSRSPCRRAGTSTRWPPTIRSWSRIAARSPRMQALPSSDPRTWTNEAHIHLNHCRTALAPAAWHRATSYYFERICRKPAAWRTSCCRTGTGRRNRRAERVLATERWLAPRREPRRHVQQRDLDVAGLPRVLDPMLDDPVPDVASRLWGHRRPARALDSGPLESTPDTACTVRGGAWGRSCRRWTRFLDASRDARLSLGRVEHHAQSSEQHDQAWTNRKFTTSATRTGAGRGRRHRDGLYPIFSYQYDTPIPNISPRKARAAAPTVVGDSKAHKTRWRAWCSRGRSCAWTTSRASCAGAAAGGAGRAGAVGASPSVATRSSAR